MKQDLERLAIDAIEGVRRLKGAICGSSDGIGVTLDLLGGSWTVVAGGTHEEPTLLLSDDGDGDALEFTPREAAALGAILGLFGAVHHINPCIQAAPNPGQPHPSGALARKGVAREIKDRSVRFQSDLLNAMGVPAAGSAAAAWDASPARADKRLQVAIEHAWTAMEVRDPRKAIRALEKSFAASPCCARAYLHAIEYADAPADALELAARAVEASDAVIGDLGFAKMRGNMWTVGGWQSRAYLDALVAVATAYKRARRCEGPRDLEQEGLGAQSERQPGHPIPPARQLPGTRCI